MLAKLDSDMNKLTGAIKFRGKQGAKGLIVDESTDSDDDEQGAVRTLITKDSIMHSDYQLKVGLRKQKLSFMVKHVKTVQFKFNSECAAMKTNRVFKDFMAQHEKAIHTGLRLLE